MIVETAFSETGSTIVHDSVFERNRSNTVEQLAHSKHYTTGCYYKESCMLTLRWPDAFALSCGGNDFKNQIKS